MDLEQLTKHQIILLTLLVSFVTSIATGIVTVSLMQQAPASVTHTINQIVERTVETVAPATAAQPAAVATTQTVVVKDDDLTAQSIAAVQKSIIRITGKGGTALIARGVMVDAKGTTLTDAYALEASGISAFDAILPDGTRVPATLVTADASTSPVAILTVALGTSTAAVPATLADPSKLQLGQSVVRIGGMGEDTVGEGVIATLPSASGGDTLVEATVDSSTPGSLIMTLFGEVVGITTGDSLTQGSDYYSVLSMPAAATTTPSHS